MEDGLRGGQLRVTSKEISVSGSWWWWVVAAAISVEGSQAFVLRCQLSSILLS